MPRGIPRSEETKAKIRAANLGDKNPMFGKHHLEDTILKIRLKATGKRPSEETRLRMRNSRIKYIDTQIVKIFGWMFADDKWNVMR